MLPSITLSAVTRSGLISLFLMLSLTSCATIPAPPAQYLEDCTLSYLAEGPATSADLARLALNREYDMKLCNADKKALRAWYDGYKEACGWKCKVEE